MRCSHFNGTHSKPHKLPENAQTPTSMAPAGFAGDRAGSAPAFVAGVHAVLGSDLLMALPAKRGWQCNFMTEAETGV